MSGNWTLSGRAVSRGYRGVPLDDLPAVIRQWYLDHGQVQRQADGTLIALSRTEGSADEHLPVRGWHAHQHRHDDGADHHHLHQHYGDTGHEHLHDADDYVPMTAAEESRACSTTTTPTRRRGSWSSTPTRTAWAWRRPSTWRMA